MFLIQKEKWKSSLTNSVISASIMYVKSSFLLPAMQT